MDYAVWAEVGKRMREQERKMPPGKREAREKFEKRLQKHREELSAAPLTSKSSGRGDSYSSSASKTETSSIPSEAAERASAKKSTSAAAQRFFKDFWSSSIDRDAA